MALVVIASPDAPNATLMDDNSSQIGPAAFYWPRNGNVVFPHTEEERCIRICEHGVVKYACAARQRR
jgi:hypothetical protein